MRRCTLQMNDDAMLRVRTHGGIDVGEFAQLGLHAISGNHHARLQHPTIRKFDKFLRAQIMQQGHRAGHKMHAQRLRPSGDGVCQRLVFNHFSEFYLSGVISAHAHRLLTIAT